MASVTFDNLKQRMDPRRLDYTINVSWKNGYVYLETPKAACSSIKRILHLIEYAGTPYAPHKNVHDRANSPLLRPLQMPASSFTNAMTGRAWFRFAFVRNPYTRILSAYLDKIGRNRIEKKAILQALGRDPKALDQTLSFEDFLTGVDSLPFTERDNHFRSQFQVLFCRDIDYHLIGAFETLEKDIDYLQQRLSVDKPFKLESVGQHETGAGDKLSDFYTNKALTLVHKIYKQDFSYFGYSDDIEKANEPPARERWAISQLSA